MICAITMMIPICFITVPPNLKLTGIQFEKYYEKIEDIDKKGFTETLVVEVRENDKKQILEAAKREADKAREPLEVYKKEKVKVKRSKRKTKTE